LIGIGEDDGGENSASRENSASATYRTSAKCVLSAKKDKLSISFSGTDEKGQDKKD
jgi:hypothetical protein